MDEVAETFVVRWVLNGAIGRLLELFDTYVVDAIVNGVGRGTRLAGDALRRAEAGQLQAYTSLFLFGVIVAVGAIFATSAGQWERLRDWLGL